MNRRKYYLHFKMRGGTLLNPQPSDTIVEQNLLDYRNDENNYYDILGISSDATLQEIKKQFYKFSRKFHPDVYQGINNPTVLQQNLNDINQTLSNPDNRNWYDRKLRERAPPKPKPPIFNNVYPEYKVAKIAGKYYAFLRRTFVDEYTPFRIWEIDEYHSKKKYSLKSTESVGIFDPISKKIIYPRKELFTNLNKEEFKNMYRKYAETVRRYMRIQGKVDVNTKPENYRYVFPTLFEDLGLPLENEMPYLPNFDDVINVLYASDILNEDEVAKLLKDIDDEIDEEGVQLIFGLTYFDIDEYLNDENNMTDEEREILKDNIVVDKNHEYYIYNENHLEKYYEDLIASWLPYFQRLRERIKS